MYLVHKIAYPVKDVGTGSGNPGGSESSEKGRGITVEDCTGVGSADASLSGSAERGLDVRTRVHLAHRLQHVQTVRRNRVTREQWERTLAERAREEYTQQRAGRVAEQQERAQERLRAFWQREVAEQPRIGQGDADDQVTG